MQRSRLVQAFALLGSRRDTAAVGETRVPARYDALTGLYNRTALIARMTDPDDAGAPGDETSLLVIQLDRLDLLNQTFGRAAGDQVLATIAHRLRDAVEPIGILGRLAGDEFACILHHPAGSDLPIRIVGAILGAVGAPIEVRGGVVNAHVAVGIAGGGRAARFSGRTLVSAKAAVAQCRRAGVSTCAVYDAEAAAGQRRRSAAETEMREAFVRGEFRPAYRPMADARTGETRGFECVATWHHPSRGVLPADAFLPAAKACGLLHTIGLELLRRACADADSWPRDQILAVDTATLKLDDPMLAQSVLRILLATGVSPKRLGFDVPRDAEIGNRAVARASLLALSDAGVRVDIDDIGVAASDVPARPSTVVSIGRPAGWRRPVANDLGPFAVRVRG